MDVKDLFESERFDLEQVRDMSEESAYWAKAADFVEDKWDSDVNELSEKQAAWINSIVDDLIERRCRRK